MFSQHFTSSPYRTVLTMSPLLQTVQWKCLGAWTGEDGQHYLSLLDTKLAQLDEAPHPRYRCAIYKHEPALGGYLQQYLHYLHYLL